VANTKFDGREVISLRAKSLPKTRARNPDILGKGGRERRRVHLLRLLTGPMELACPLWTFCPQPVQSFTSKRPCIAVKGSIGGLR